MQSYLNPVNPLAAQFINPIQQAVISAQNFSRKCQAISDENFINSGVQRVLNTSKSGRDHLQEISTALSDPVKRSTYFEALKSSRRLNYTQKVADHVFTEMNEVMPDLLAKALPMLDGYEVFAGDGHWHQHAVHDPANVVTGNKYATGHLYGLNLRNQGLFHLSVADQITRLKENDIRGLKRQTAEHLRQGAPLGTKVIWLWDPAGIDLLQWYKWKQSSGIYFISPAKSNMLIHEGRAAMRFDRSDPINAGVLGDYLWAGSTRGMTMRLVHYKDPVTGKEFHFLTSLMDKEIPPGVIAHLYRMRWDIEKVFDDVKNKLHETKAWASTPEAKSIQATFICITHNLIRCFEERIALNYKVSNVAELKRKAKRLEKIQLKFKKQGKEIPVLFEMLQRVTQCSVKFIRWIRYSVFDQPCPRTALNSLRYQYDRL
jgi:hypothetical protein